VTLRALDKDLCGLYHLCSSGQASRYAVAKEYARLAGLKNEIVPCPMSEFASAYPAKRPGYSAMSNAKISAALGIEMKRWEEGMGRFFIDAVNRSN
jgi:dTDP-4-dehydrorhamnose reductase